MSMKSQVKDPGITLTPAKTASLPWTYRSGEVDEIRDADGGRVCTMHQLKGNHGLAGRRDSGEVEGSANLIVEAANSHTALAEENALLRKALKGEWANTICGACQIMDAWKYQEEWTEWDSKIRAELSKILEQLYKAALEVKP